MKPFNYIGKYERGLVNAIRNDTDNSMNNRKNN